MRLELGPQLGQDIGGAPANVLGNRQPVRRGQRLIYAHVAEVGVKKAESDGHIGLQRFEQRESFLHLMFGEAEIGFGALYVLDVSTGADPFEDRAIVIEECTGS